MHDIRSPNGVLIGKYCEKTKTLHIKSGSKERIIKIPREGLSVTIINDNGQPESTYIIPPDSR